MTTVIGTNELRDGSVVGHVHLPSGLDWLDRAMLAGDGTVTTLLETCLADRIATRTLRSAGPAPPARLIDRVGRWWRPDVSRLGLRPSEEIAARRAVLYHERTGLPYVLADSLIVPGRLPAPVAAALERQGSSIGRLLRAHAVESRREILATGLLRAAEAAEPLQTGVGDELAWREYAIVVRGRIAVLLTELVVPGRLMATASPTPANPEDEQHPSRPRRSARPLVTPID